MLLIIGFRNYKDNYIKTGKRKSKQIFNNDGVLAPFFHRTSDSLGTMQKTRTKSCP